LKIGTVSPEYADRVERVYIGEGVGACHPRGIDEDATRKAKFGVGFVVELIKSPSVTCANVGVGGSSKSWLAVKSLDPRL